MKRLLLLFAVLAFSFNCLAASQTILAAQTDAGQSSTFKIQRRSGVATVILYAASGLTTGEYADVQISHDGGTTWQDLYQDGTQVRLTDTNNAVSVYGIGTYRIDKEATTNAAGVFLNIEDDL